MNRFFTEKQNSSLMYEMILKLVYIKWNTKVFQDTIYRKQKFNYFKNLTTNFVGKIVKKPSRYKDCGIQFMDSKHHFPLKEAKNPQEIADF